MTTHDDEPAGTSEASGPSGLVRLRLDVAYDGATFCGWARQPGLRSVQGTLAAALRAVLRIDPEVPVRVAVAGRTDAGVHATGQVCHADVPAGAWRATGAGGVTAGSGSTAPDPRISEDVRIGELVRRRLNGALEADLRVRAVRVAPVGFDARWSAAWRRYAYLVADDPVGQDPRTRGHVLWHPRPLDVESMDAAAQPFRGEHDFTAFCRSRPGASTVRTVHEVGWRRPDAEGRTHVPQPADPGAGPVALSIRADAFCHSMVRSLVGAFLAVGDGRWPVDRPARLLAAGVRVPSIANAPAHGLTLVEVGYPPDAQLAAQAQRARRWRGP